jgi:hypothetical protein
MAWGGGFPRLPSFPLKEVRWVKRALTLILALAFLSLAGCLPQEMVSKGPIAGATGISEDPMSPSVELPFETIDQGIRSGIRDARQVVVRDPETWCNLWAEHVKGRVPEPPLPPVDFVREMVIAFFLGEKPTAGYEVDITEIILLEGRLVVQVDIKSPPPGVALFQVLTQPFHIVRLFQSELPVEFVTESLQSPKTISR